MARAKFHLANFTQRLSVDESRWVLAFLSNGGNATQAVIETGWADKDDYLACNRTAAYLLNQPHLREAIQDQLDAMVARHMISLDRIYRELGRTAFYDIRKAFDANGDALPMSQLPEELSAAVEGFETETRIVPGVPGTTRITKYKFAKKSVALNTLLDRMMGAVSSKVELSGPGGTPLGASSSAPDFSGLDNAMIQKLIDAYDAKDKKVVDVSKENPAPPSDGAPAPKETKE